MAAFSQSVKGACGLLSKCNQLRQTLQSLRPLSTSQNLLSTDDTATPGWFSKLLNVRTIAPSKESHSRQLSDKELVYEIQFHSVKPEYMEEYLNQFRQFQQLMHDKNTGANLKGSFTVEIGDQDEAIHIWEYGGGYPVLNNATHIYRTDKDFIEYRIARNKMLRSRRNQIMLAFSFWPELAPREPSHIYEMRSYTLKLVTPPISSSPEHKELKAGTMIEWANNWSRGLQHRKDSQPVTGMFSQIGQLYQVHHIWCYNDLQTRKKTREEAWSRPGWDNVVAYTVPLIRHMESRILVPTPFSPLQ